MTTPNIAAGYNNSPLEVIEVHRQKYRQTIMDDGLGSELQGCSI
jgi:hypothetical protein